MIRRQTRSRPVPALLPQQLADVRAQTLALAGGLSGEDCALQSMPDASPVKWHLAHTTWFFEVFVLESHEPGFRPFDPAFRVLFNSYYEGIGNKHPRPERGMISRPDLDRVLAYRREVDERVQALVRDPARLLRVAPLLTLGMHHEQQHQELILTDLKDLLSRNPARPAYRDGWPLTPVAPEPLRWLSFEGGIRPIGHEGRGFAFDNEQPRHDVLLRPFELASRPISHGDVIDFIDDDGYRRPELWLSAGWDSVLQGGWQAPLHWERGADGWSTFTLRGLCPVSRDVPAVHLSYFEADAIARWMGARLPSEAEWEVACGEEPVEGNLLESGIYHPCASRKPARPGRPVQMFGDVWEWTRSDYGAYPGFRTAEGAVGEYNGKFMCGQYVLRGGSCATAASHLRATYRNFFPPQARWQFSGARVARDA